MASRRISGCNVVWSMIFAAVSACASYEPAALPATSMVVPSAVCGGDPAITASIFRNPHGKEEVFDADFDEVGIVVIQVAVRNGGERTALVRRSDMLLRFPDGGEIGTISPASAALRIEEEGSVTWSFLAFGHYGAIAASDAEDEAKSARINDYQRTGFSDTLLGPGESAHGFVFFIPPHGMRSVQTAKLIVRFVDSNTATINTAATSLGRVAFGCAGPT